MISLCKYLIRLVFYTELHRYSGLYLLFMFIVRNVHYGVKDWGLLITANVAAKSILFAAAMQPVAGGSKAAI